MLYEKITTFFLFIYLGRVTVGVLHNRDAVFDGLSNLHAGEGVVTLDLAGQVALCIYVRHTGHIVTRNLRAVEVDGKAVDNSPVAFLRFGIGYRDRESRR